MQNCFLTQLQEWVRYEHFILIDPGLQKERVDHQTSIQREYQFQTNQV